MELNCIFSDPINLGEPENYDWEYSSINCTATSTEEQSTSTIQSIENGFTYGEIVISFFLMSIFFVMFFSALFFAVRGIRIKNV